MEQKGGEKGVEFEERIFFDDGTRGSLSLIVRKWRKRFEFTVIISNCYSEFEY